MLATLQNEDLDLELHDISKQDVYVSLTLEDVKNFLEGLGVSQISVNEDKDY